MTTSRTRAARFIAGACLLALTGTACRIAPVTLRDENPLAVRSVILASDGTQLATLFEENRREVTFEDIPQHISRAIVASEDARFWTHSGVDAPAIARALARNLQAGRVQQGGSTISQQLAKLMFSGNGPRTLKQKIIETRMATALEAKYSKEEILTMYLNRAYFGERAYGIAAAAETFFDKKLAEVTLAEAALMAGLVKAPTTLNPFENRPAALKRRAYVLGQMSSLGLISQKEADRARREKLRLKRTDHLATVKQPHWVRYIEREVLANKAFGRTEGERAQRLYRGGLRIVTTLNPTWQRYAEAAVAEHLGRPTDPEVGLASVDPRTGAIRALVGGRDFISGQYDLASQGKRQPGSSFKPFVLAAALEQGISPESLYASGPGLLKIGGGQTWKIVNYGDGRGAGTVSIRRGMQNSYNGVFARLVMKVGPAAVVDVAHRAGITSHLDAYPSISLGALTIGVAPLEMASAFGTFANNGLYFKPHGISRVTDATGKVLWDETTMRGEQRLDPNVAYGVTDVLRGVVCCGTARAAGIGRPMAAKTGTTDEHKDAWLVGYTPDVSTAVWVGHRQPRSMGRNFFGGSFPSRIWRSYMSKALAGSPELSFVDPPGQLTLRRRNGEKEPCPTSSGGAVPSPVVDPVACPSSSPSPSPSPSPEPPRPSKTPTPKPTKTKPPTPTPTPTPPPPSPSTSPTTPPPSPDPSPTSSGAPGPKPPAPSPTAAPPSTPPADP